MADQFAVAITATDAYSDAFKGFVKNVRGHFGEIEKAGKETGAKLGEIFEGMGRFAGFGAGVGGAVGIAGMAEWMNHFASAGEALHRTSQRIGVDASAIQAFSQASYLAGGNAQSGAQGIETLGQKLHDAAWGRDQNAVAVLNHFGIAVKDSNGHIRSAKDVLPELADKIKGLKDPYQQAALAQALLGQAGIDLLPVLREGREGIKRLTDAAERHGLMDREAIEAAHKLDRAQRDVTSSVQGWGYAIAKDLAPNLTKALSGTSEWLDKMREAPAALTAVEIAVASLGAAIAIGLTGKVLAFTLAWMKSPLGWLLGRAAMGTTLGLPAGLSGDTDRNPGLSGAQSAAGEYGVGQGGPGFFGESGTLENFLRHPLSAMGIGAGKGPDPRGMGAVIRAAALKYGHDPEIAMRVAQAEGLGRFMGDRRTSFGAFQLHTGGGLGDEFQRETGLDPRDPRNEAATIDWAMKNLGRTGWGPYHGASRIGVGAREGIGTGPGVTPSGAIPPPRSTMPPWFNEQSRGTFTRDPMTGGSPDLINRQQVAALDGFKGELAAERSGPTFLPPVPDYSGALDSRHEVQLDITGAPPGSRVGLRRAEGPADFGVRVQHAMGAL